MKYLLFAITIAVFFSCSDAPKDAGASAQNESYTTFKFSKEMATMDVRDPSNWCNANYGEAALIGADPQNFSRRIFEISDVPSRVAVDFGHQSAVFMLTQKGKHVELSTSENFPNCLSNKSNIQISPEGISFRYHNKMDISFDVYLQELPSGLQIALDLPTSGGHGLSVLRCEACK